MNVFLTFDIEIWCNDWNALDERFPAAFERYVYGRSAAGEYALPRTLELLAAHGLKGVFFVEPLFSARFGARHLETIVGMIQDAGQEVQLHLHPEWTDEIRPAVFPDKPYKRQHLFHYSLDEQTRLIALGLDLLRGAGARDVNAFRAGSFGANRDTLLAAEACGLRYDSSLNMCASVSGRDIRDAEPFHFPRPHGALQLVPMTVFRDGRGRLRPAQVGACSFAELKDVLADSAARGHGCVTLLSHNFEMLRAGSSKPDKVVVSRFEALCRHLARHRDTLPTRGFHDALEWTPAPPDGALARSGRLATGRRLVEQALRRLN
ncbi:polysaccharide deacetylase family protein [Pseudothauera rhizosphaerae]|uniref:Polysaccharide deacetylase n=1 Tax=Pseudothauera rhizosphaerae TaxID=2565932 RepID=A0A4V3WB24_9RHOO|nr:polysaccharide deacetylase family protein [Pseudothauera rhizosphaerae]THF61620.1 polysaccharide deacetylase [Pseudothauera rhizosphaerae]